MSSAEVAAVFKKHTNWETAARVRAVALANYVQGLSNKTGLSFLSPEDLRNKQFEDRACPCKVIH